MSEKKVEKYFLTNQRQRPYCPKCGRLMKVSRQTSDHYQPIISKECICPKCGLCLDMNYILYDMGDGNVSYINADSANYIGQLSNDKLQAINDRIVWRKKKL